MSVHGLFNKLQRTFLYAVVCVAMSSLAFAQEQQSSGSEVGVDQPTAVVAINSLDKFLPDLMYLIKASGQPPMIGGMISMSVNQYSQGIDRTRPIGVAVTLKEDGQPQSFLMLPIKDIEDFFAGTAQVISRSDLGNNRYSLNVGMSNVYGRFDNGWLFVTQFEDDLEKIPSNPQGIISRLSDRYDLSVNIRIQSIPAELRDEFIKNLDQGFEAAMSRGNAGKSAEEIAQQKETGKRAMQQIKDTIQDTDQFLVGINIDKDARAVVFDFGTKFVAGSRLAKQTEMQKGLTSAFASYALESDPIQAKYRSKMGEEEIKMALDNIEMQMGQLDTSLRNSVNDEVARDVIKQLVNIFSKSFKSTLKGGNIDGCYAINFENGINVLGGGTVANAKELEQDFVAFLKQYAGNLNAPQITAGPTNVGGLNTYTGTWKVPGDSTEMQQVMGETVPFVVAFGDNQAALALGVNSQTALAAAIDRAKAASETPSNPFDLQIELTPILQYATTLAKDEKVLTVLRAAIAKSAEFSSNDMVRVTSRAVDNGLIMRLTIEEGVMQISGAAATASAPQQRGR